MSRIKVLLTAIVFLAMSFVSFAQTENTESAANTKKKAPGANNAVLISPFYTALFPVGELSNRFGFSNNIGLNISFKVKKNWLIGVEGAYIFGSKVKENPIAQIETQSTGQMIGLDGSLDRKSVV